MRDTRITVLQVFAAMGIKPSNEQAWSVGNRMQNLYKLEHGEQPPKDNRPKTSGHGSHCFALYPAHWRPRIEAEIRKLQAVDRAQGDLFGGA